MFRETYIKLLSNIPPEKQGYIEWMRVLFWLYPKFVVLPYIKNIGKKRKENARHYITFAQTTEGLGGQLCRYSAARILGKIFGLEYVHKPISNDIHSPGLNWQKFLGLGGNSVDRKTVLKKNARICLLPRFDLRYLSKLQLDLISRIINVNRFNGDTLFIVTGYSLYPMNSYTRWPEIIDDMRRDYFGNSALSGVKRRDPFKKNKIGVALHIRRGNVADMKKNNDAEGINRWIGISWYASVLKRLNRIYGKRADIKIFSDAVSISELSALRRYKNAKIYLQKDSEDSGLHAFNSMAVADIVVCGLSSFSYFAATLSDGIKIVPPAKVRVNYFPDTNTPGWIFPDEKGAFDEREIKKYLNR